jgi:predicted ATPase
MSITFKIIDKGSAKNPILGSIIGYLEKDDWDDYSFRTSFDLTILNGQEESYDLGHMKIGFQSQTVPPMSVSNTFERLSTTFNTIEPDMFSLGQDIAYYSTLASMPKKMRECILKGLNDVAFNLKILEKVKEEAVFKDSLLRYKKLSDIRGWYNRTLNGLPALTPFNFFFSKCLTQEYSDLVLEFDTEPFSTPPSNIHVLIGRNGAGKTTILNSMVYSLLSKNQEKYGSFYTVDFSGKKSNLPEDYFSSVVLVSFSAFDSFEYPETYLDECQKESPEKAPFKFSHIGLKDGLYPKTQSHLKNKEKLCDEFIDSLEECLRFGHTKEMWGKAMHRLKSDDNFAEMKLEEYASGTIDIEKVVFEAKTKFMSMSSGHAIVLLTITKLIMKVDQKSLILIDEPECHLHPPLLAAFMHSLSDLLILRNGISIIATHSPVVLQEVPQKCIWNIIRYDGGLIRPQKLEIESYGENVGVLTREVFGLEVSESGFHKVLADFVNKGHTYEQILERHGDSLGLEGRSILKALTFKRDKLKT